MSPLGLWVLLRAKQAADRSAVLITGNPRWTQGPHRRPASRFYREVSDTLKEHGYRVTRDPGEPHTAPPPADLWVGHSRGADRLRFAPPGTRTVALGSSQPGAVNHPDDVPGPEPVPAHYSLTEEMRQALRGAP